MEVAEDPIRHVMKVVRMFDFKSKRYRKGGGEQTFRRTSNLVENLLHYEHTANFWKIPGMT